MDGGRQPIDDRWVLGPVEALRHTRDRLSASAPVSAASQERWSLVQDAADGLGQTARRPACPLAARRILLDWRDRLGSHVLAARALADLDVHSDLAEQFLRRGLDEVIAEAPQRLREANAQASAQATVLSPATRR